MKELKAILISLILLLLTILSIIFIQNKPDRINLEDYIVKYELLETEQKALFPIHNGEGILFLDKDGHKVFLLKDSSYDYQLGYFNNGYIVIAVQKKDNKSRFDKHSSEYKLMNIFIVDTKANAKKVPFKARIYMSPEWSDNYYVPIFKDGLLALQTGMYRYTIVDTNGKVVKTIINDKEYDPENYAPIQVFHPDKEPKPIDWSDDGFMKYTDKNGKVIISLDTYYPGCEAPGADWNFYDGIAMVFFDKHNVCAGKAEFIYTNGKPINNEKYTYAEPFYDKERALVCTEKHCGYIDRQGKWVYKQRSLFTDKN